jgi:hypothetical protein
VIAWDRYLGTEVELPEVVENGRYVLLTDTLMNGNLLLNSGKPLLSYGEAKFRLDNYTGSFHGCALPGNEMPDQVLTKSAVPIIARLAIATGEKTSPLLPAELAEHSELNELEKALESIVKRGHLHEISRRPRFNMVYREEVTDLSRVKKVANGALGHLASHSEDWYRRTLSGVLPKRLLSLVSDDEWGIYENRVYVSLLDTLDKYLRLRLREVKALRDQFERALNLTESTELFYRLRETLCALWGQGMSEHQTEASLNSSEGTVELLEFLHRKVSLLRQDSLYQALKGEARIPRQLRPTNILLHDQHYRHLRTLWHLQQKEAITRRNTPSEIISGEEEFLSSFQRYLSHLVRRYFLACPLIAESGGAPAYRFCGEFIEFSEEEDGIVLRFKNRELWLIPALSCESDLQTTNQDGSGRVILYCFDEAHAEQKVLDVHAPGKLQINPLDFYVDEKLKILIGKFLWYPLYNSHGRSVKRLPRSVIDVLKSFQIGFVDQTEWVFDKPLADSRSNELFETLALTGANQESLDSIKSDFRRLTGLSRCWQCGSEGMWNSRGTEFEASCSTCRTRWGIYRRNGIRHVEMDVSGHGSVERTFENFGGEQMVFVLNHE